MSTYTEDQFFEDVKAEATALKETATKEELAKLRAHFLNPFQYDQCVYGLMTGSCYSGRASELIFNCCPRYFKNEVDGREAITSLDTGGASRAIEFVNGSQIPGVSNSFEFDKHRERISAHFSSIEMYIATEGAKIPELIAFLKDETKILSL